MYLIPVSICKFLMNLQEFPWTCQTEADPFGMRDILQEAIDNKFRAAGLEANIYFQVITRAVFSNNYPVHASFLRIASRDPELIIGDVESIEMIGKEMVVRLTDRYDDKASFRSVSFLLYDDI